MVQEAGQKRKKKGIVENSGMEEVQKKEEGKRRALRTQEKWQSYENDGSCKEFVVGLFLTNNHVKCSKKAILMKIYRYVQGTGIGIESNRMVGFSRAEITCKRSQEANKMLEGCSNGDGAVGAFLPGRKWFRKGVIKEY